MSPWWPLLGLLYPDSKVHEANMGPIWGRQDPGGPHVGPNEPCYLGTDVPFLSQVTATHLKIGTCRCHLQMLVFNGDAWYALSLTFHSLAPESCGCNLKLVIFKFISRIRILSIFYEISLRWMPQDLTDDQLTLACCHQAANHYLSHILTKICVSIHHQLPTIGQKSRGSVTYWLLVW